MAKKINKKIVKKVKTSGTTYKLKVSKTVGTKIPPIDENTLHRAWVVKRKRQIEKLKNDIENGCYDGIVSDADEQICPSTFKGTHRINKEMRANYKRRMWQAFGVIVGLAVLYVVIINVFNI